MFLTICLNPVLQKTLVLDSLHPGEVNRSTKHYFDISGKGVNVSRVLSQLNEKVIHVTQLGKENIALFEKMYKARPKNEDWILKKIISNGSIRYCYTLINKESHETTEITEPGAKVDSKIQTKIFEQICKEMKRVRVVILSGTKAPGFSSELYPKIVELAKKSGKIVILDIQGEDLVNSLPYSPDFIKPNFKEFLTTFSKERNASSIHEEKLIFSDIEIVKNLMIEIAEKYNTTPIITAGKNPVFYVTNKNGEEFSSANKSPKVITEVPISLVTPVNTVGCGDTFTAGFASCYLKTGNVYKSILFANECSVKNALNIRPGTIK